FANYYTLRTNSGRSAPILRRVLATTCQPAKPMDPSCIRGAARYQARRAARELIPKRGATALEALGASPGAPRKRCPGRVCARRKRVVPGEPVRAAQAPSWESLRAPQKGCPGRARARRETAVLGEPARAAKGRPGK